MGVEVKLSCRPGGASKVALGHAPIQITGSYTNRSGTSNGRQLTREVQDNYLAAEWRDFGATAARPRRGECRISLAWAVSAPGIRRPAEEVT